MGKLLLNLRHVPDDEADEVREMLDEHGIEFYETPPNRWGISVGGIWVRDPEEMPRARELMQAYQARRRERALADREERRRAGELETLATMLRREPLRLIAAIAVAGLIVYLMLLPFLHLGD